MRLFNFRRPCLFYFKFNDIFRKLVIRTITAKRSILLKSISNYLIIQTIILQEKTIFAMSIIKP